MDYLQRICNEVFGADANINEKDCFTRTLTVPHGSQIISNHLYFVETLRKWLREGQLRKVIIYEKDGFLNLELQIRPNGNKQNLNEIWKMSKL